VSSLCHLLQQRRDPASEVARDTGGNAATHRTIRWGEFQQLVAGLRDRLAGEPRGAWVLVTEDACAFAVGLLALWHSGRHAISPPNRQPRSLRALQTRAAGILSDQPNWFSKGASLHPLIDAKRGDPDSLIPLDPGALAIELFTSGTTGDEKLATKRIHHLEDEVSELCTLWDEKIGAASVVSAASHQHLYGLLFGVLWPLQAGRAFHRRQYLQPGELVPRMREAGDCVLVSVPTHLKNLARHRHLASLRGVCRAVFSSGGPLATDTAHAVARIIGEAPIEVLGSTETGGIAWRSQEPGAGERLWTPFPSVRVACDRDESRLLVRSPFVSVDAGVDGFATGDRIALHSDGSFSLEGRLDHVVKVGEQRLDLTRMETQLRSHGGVEEAALMTIEREAGLRVAATIVPSEAGWRQIRHDGRRAFVRGLGASLAGDWDPVLHPRYWRVLAETPANAQGKITLAALRDLFRRPDSVGTETDRPEVLEQLRESNVLERGCRVPRDLGCFPGHFPGAPVVPGVLQLDWVMELATELLNESPRIAEIESLKFSAPLRPGDSFRILVRVVAKSRVDFRIWGESGAYARGRVRLAASRGADT
jgi:acyl-CoA synthetase (AMP-forming)/AMP-acid ligase II/3-hydroxymyristoyl/3-hydroxydecanoyl-(acyl carrier protein) dehydratase